MYAGRAHLSSLVNRWLSAAAIRCRAVAEREAIPVRQALEDEVRRLLDRARRRTGASAAEMVERLGPLQARTAGTRRSWYDWHERPETVSALAVLGALHLLGPAGAVEAIFSRAAERAEGSPESQVTDLKRQLLEVQEELTRQRRHNEVVEARLEELASRLEPQGAALGPTSAVPLSSQRDLEHVLGTVESQVAALGQQLGRQWSEGSPYVAAAATPAERLIRRVGALETRLAEIASIVDARYGGYPPAPDPSRGDDAVWVWASDVVSMLRQHLTEVNLHASRFAKQSRERRRKGESAG